MAKARTTSSKSWLTVWILTGLLFTVVWSAVLYNGIQQWEPQWAVLLMIWMWLLIFIVCIKWYINLIKKKRIKKNKELMRKVDAKVTWFEAWNVNQETHTPTSYYFNASDWIETYSSEEFHANVIWWCGDISESIRLMQIPYDPARPEDTIRALNERLNQIEVELQQHSWPKALLLRWAYAATQNAKERLESWQIPYMEFKWHKLSVGDHINVYVDPQDQKNYWIDTDFLYQ